MGTKRGPISDDLWERYRLNQRGYRYYIDTIANSVPRGSYTVLNLGCGKGLVASILAQTRDHIVHGFDSEQEYVEKAQNYCIDQLLACVFEVQNLSKISLKRQYDYAVCIDLLQTIPIYKNIFKLMRENITNYTVLTTIDPKYHRLTKNAPRRMLSQDQLETLFKRQKVSFKLIERKKRTCGGDLIYKLWNEKKKKKRPRKVTIRF